MVTFRMAGNLPTSRRKKSLKLLTLPQEARQMALKYPRAHYTSCTHTCTPAHTHTTDSKQQGQLQLQSCWNSKTHFIRLWYLIQYPYNLCDRIVSTSKVRRMVFLRVHPWDIEQQDSLIAFSTEEHYLLNVIIILQNMKDEIP